MTSRWICHDVLIYYVICWHSEKPAKRQMYYVSASRHICRKQYTCLKTDIRPSTPPSAVAAAASSSINSCSSYSSSNPMPHRLCWSRIGRQTKAAVQDFLEHATNRYIFNLLRSQRENERIRNALTVFDFIFEPALILWSVVATSIVISTLLLL